MKTLFTTFLLTCALCAKGQTYTTTYPKDIQKLAAKWVKKGEWRNGFTKASPAPTVNLTEFYIQYQRNPEQWKALFRWLQETDLLAIPAGHTPVPGTQLTVSVEDGDNWCSQQDLQNGKGSESHRQKIDVMYVVRGYEGFCLLDHETSKPQADYKPDRQEYFFDYNRLLQFENIPGTFNIMFPCDWHVAKVKTKHESQNLRVLVIKMDYAL